MSCSRSDKKRRKKKKIRGSQFFVDEVDEGDDEDEYEDLDGEAQEEELTAAELEARERVDNRISLAEKFNKTSNEEIAKGFKERARIQKMQESRGDYMDAVGDIVKQR